jgi:hypothetical protein
VHTLQAPAGPGAERPSFARDRVGKRADRLLHYVKFVRFPLSPVAVLRQYSVKPNACTDRASFEGDKEMERVGKVVDFLVLSVSILMVVMGLASLLRF